MPRESSPSLSKTEHHSLGGDFSEARFAAARERLRRQGLTLRDWAVANGHKTSFVYKIMGGTKKCHFGEGHDIAIKLGLKDGPAAPVPHG